MEILTIETPSLGDRSYLATDGDVAIVVDPQRDLDRVTRLVSERGLRVTHVLETHIHNDYVTGGYALARDLGAEYVVSAHDAVSFERTGVRDGDELRAGAMRIDVLHTPGHTPTHLSYAVHDDQGRPVAVFTGGSMLFGTVGRTDLISPDLTEELARAQYHSVRRLAATLPDEVAVHPTHGFGSHCSATQATKAASTIGAERTDNPALVHTDVDSFVREMVEGLTPYPTYYAQMGPLNATGPSAFDATPPAAMDLAAVVGAVEDGAWVLDLRDRTAYTRSHLLGTINAELRNDLPTYVGWLVPWDAAVVLVGDDEAAITEAQRMLTRIGYDRLAGRSILDPAALDGHPQGATMPRRRFSDLAATSSDERVVLDVRDGWEWESGHHADALHVPFHELPERLGEVPADRPVWVYCATGARASIAVSLLERAGREPVLIDDFCLPGDVPGEEVVDVDVDVEAMAGG
ncbi:MAG: MBL fold metallo-hydrolase [Actinobacteria bacterium]|nr:MBL fold metallo-hydrolase [Actinomycetota bacterium]